MSVLDIATRPAGATGAGRSRGLALIDWVEARAADVDAGRAPIREGLSELGRLGLPKADLGSAIDLVRTVARSDLATAFSAWAHRMVIEYVVRAPVGTAARELLPRLASAEVIGATALAAGTAHVLGGAPLPISFRRDGDELILDGRIPWASNLVEPFLVVTAAADADDPGRTVVVSLTGDQAGVEPAPFPALLALGATGSTTVRLANVRVPRDQVLSNDLSGFVADVLAHFLLLQGAFCAGLADRALAEAAVNLGPLGEALRADLDETTREAARADERTATLAADAVAGRVVDRGELLALRLRWSELATRAVHLELAATGGRGYLAASPTARRVREAAFLPVQAPTEVMLRWLLSRFV